MRAHYFQHVPFEGLGSIAPWLESKRARVTCTRFFETTEFPDPDDIDLLVVLGGPMSANDEPEFPWLTKEKAFLRNAIASNKPVLGICLGAQLIANALGARVYRNREKEIGWYPVTAVNRQSGTFAFPERLLAFHWHGETFDLPPGAIHLARSEACEHQAFQFGNRVIGLQFHLESTTENAAAIVDGCRNELAPARYIQSGEDILGVPQRQFTAINTVMDSILEYLTR